MPASWISRVWQEYRAGTVTRAEKDVLLTLATYRSHGGTAWPSHATLADRSHTCVRTVQRALASARDLQLVSWVERRVRAGWRWLRSSNLYRLTVPDFGVVKMITPKRWLIATVSTTGQPGREGESQKKKAALDDLLAAAAAAPDLLTLRRRAIEARLAVPVA